MRIWSIHPKYLDAKGIVALWRETLLAKNVLQGKTKGYKNHPQLVRFKKTNNAVATIDLYLSHVYIEAANRGYNFNREKINWEFEDNTLTVTTGQVYFEFKHLLNKLKHREEDIFRKLKHINTPETHPLFMVVDGEVEEWEIVNDKSQRTIKN